MILKLKFILCIITSIPVIIAFVSTICLKYEYEFDSFNKEYSYVFVIAVVHISGDYATLCV